MENPLPVTLTAETTKSAEPVSVMATVFVLLFPTVTLPKERDTGETFIAGVGALTPVPSKDTVVGDPAALLEIVAVPVVVPVAWGLKVALAV